MLDPGRHKDTCKKGSKIPMAQGQSYKIFLMVKGIWTSRLSMKNSLTHTGYSSIGKACGSASPETEFFIDNLLVRIHSIIEMILVDRPCATLIQVALYLPGSGMRLVVSRVQIPPSLDAADKFSPSIGTSWTRLTFRERSRARSWQT